MSAKVTFLRISNIFKIKACLDSSLAINKSGLRI